LATDLSARSDRALDRAVLLAKQWQARLTVLHVLEDRESPPDSADPLPSWRRPPDALGILKKNIMNGLIELAGAATILVEEGEVVDTIIRVANGGNSELIAIGVARGGLLSELMLGRTVDRLLRRSRIPLVVVKNRARHRYRHIVVATDFSDSSRHAFVAAMQFFAAEKLTLFHAYEPPMSGLASDAAFYRQEFRKIAEQDCNDFLRDTEKLEGAWRQPDVLLEYGTPSRLLRDYVTDNAADLVVVGTHGRSAVFDILIGSVAKRIVDDVPCDILVVREPRAKAEG